MTDVAVSSEQQSSASSGAADESYIVTASGNYVSRGATLHNPVKGIEIKGRSVVMNSAELHGEKSMIPIGRFCIIQPNVTIQPPSLLLPQAADTGASQSKDPSQQQRQYVPVTIGSHTVIEHGATSCAAAIGSYCWIGWGVKIGERCIIKDCCVIAPNVTIPPDTVIPPFTR